ncbi:MAG TPA: glycosyltransferase family 2 protein [Gaiellaceae bacterium]
MTPDVSILLVSWNTRELTLECLDSLRESIGAETSLQVVVVENGSRDGSAEALAARDDIELVVNDENRGYAAAVNQCYALATGESVLLLNSDLEFEPGALGKLVDFLREHPDVAGVGPLYLNPDGTPQQHHFRLPSFANLLANISGTIAALPPIERRERSYRMLDDDFSRPRPVEQPSASCLLLRRSCLPDGPLMDEAFPIYFNDVALARTLALSGHTLWMTPEAVTIHEHGASTRQMGGARARQYIASLIRYASAAEPRYRVAVVQAIVLLQGLVRAAGRRPGALPPRQLWKAVSGDPGPLPQAPA